MFYCIHCTQFYTFSLLFLLILFFLLSLSVLLFLSYFQAAVLCLLYVFLFFLSSKIEVDEWQGAVFSLKWDWTYTRVTLGIKLCVCARACVCIKFYGLAFFLCCKVGVFLWLLHPIMHIPFKRKTETERGKKKGNKKAGLWEVTTSRKKQHVTPGQELRQSETMRMGEA